MQLGFVKKALIYAVITAAVILISFYSAEKALAASAAVSLSGGGTVEKGDTVTITLKYTGATFGAADAVISYDSDVLEYSSCSGSNSEAYGQGGTVKVSMYNSGGSDNLTCKLKFKALKVGKSTVKAVSDGVYDIDFAELSAESKSTTVTVKDSSTEVSTNANLSALYVSAGKLSPAFSKNVTSYTVNVGNEVTTCLLTVYKEDSKSNYVVTGSKDLKVGENTRKVTVTAESGKTKTYTLTIIRAAASGSDNKDEDDNQQNNQPADQPEKDYIEAVAGKKTYMVCEDLSAVDIPQNFSVSASDYNDVQIPVIKDAEGKYVLGYLKEVENAEADEGQWFFYNEEENEFSAKKSLTAEALFAYGQQAGPSDPQQDGDMDTDNEPAEPDEELIGTTELMLMLFGATLALLLLVVIVLQVNIIRDNKAKKK